jgi:O-antigen ligase
MSSVRTMNAIDCPKHEHQELATRGGSLLFYGTFGLLLLGPLAFGAVEPWSILMIEVGSAGLLALWIGKQVIENTIRVRQNSLFLPIAIFGVLIASQLVFGMSAYFHATMSAALLYISYAVLCFLASQTLVRGSQARRLALIVSIYGAVVASFALVQGISSNGKLYWLRQPRMGGWIYGPYVNHNHYAGLMEMLIPIPLVLSLTQLASARARNLAATAAAVMVGTIFLSGSRGGMLAIVIELLILGVTLVQHRRGWRTTIGVGLFVAIVAGLLIWVGGSDLSQRIASAEPSRSEISGDVRSDINRDGLRMFLKKPILGWGLGTFPVVYPQFRSFYTNFFVNEAHNDYLQVLVEMGLLGVATMVLFIIVAFKQAIQKLKYWTSDINGAAALACLLGMSGILVHSAVDFNLQVPANAALFYVLCTVAASPRFLKPARRHRAMRSVPEGETGNQQEVAQQPAATNF